MRITELFTAQSIALDEALTDQEQIISRLVELQATHGNITDKDAYKKALYAREAEGSTYVDNGITVPHAKTNVVTRPSLAALRLSSPVQYNAEDDGTTDLLFAIAAPENGSLHVDMLARMMQMLMNEDFVEKLKAAKTPAEFLDCIDAQEEAQFGAESFTQQEIPQSGYRILAVTACVNGIAHTYMAAEALTKAGDKLGLPTKVETNGSDGAKNILTREEIANCDGIIVAAEKKVETARFDGKPVLFTRVDEQHQRYYKEGDMLPLGGLSLRVMETPGHSEGSVCLLLDREHVIFAGDTLFRCSCGRCDFPGGSYPKMLTSLGRLAVLEGDWRVLPGLDRETTLDFERRMNPYMRQGTAQ